MVEVAKIEKGIARYLDAELVPKLPENSWKQFGVGIVSGLVAKRGGMVIEQYKAHPAAVAFGLVDPSGCIDVDILRELAKERVPEGGLAVDVPMIGKLKIYRADIDTLYGYIVG